MASERNLRTVLARSWPGAILVVLFGLAFLQPIGDSLVRFSYDVPFIFTTHRVPDDLVMVYLDTKVKLNLRQPPNVPLARRFYTRLLRRLNQDGARLVIFDIVFDTPDPDPSVDAEFAGEMRKNGHVVLVTELTGELQGNTFSTSVVPPIPRLADAAAGWGLARVMPDPADDVIRILDTGTPDFPSVAWVAAKIDGAPVTRNPAYRLKPRWLNYYCQPAVLRSVNLDTALDSLTNGFFKDKVVVVGARAGVGVAGAEREAFPTPYSRIGGFDASGPSIQAMNFLNLRNSYWKEERSDVMQAMVVILVGVIVTFLLMYLRPWAATRAALLWFAGFAMAGATAQVGSRWWFPWMVPAAVQPSVALVWSVGYQYLVESRRRKKLRQAFGAYLSPYMADRIADSEFNLSLGGKEVEATVMFTDLEGFTKMSERLPPAEVSRILTTYFNQTTRAILEQEGTIIKYIGDAVMAVWGAPLPDTKHAEKAVLAAWGMSQASQQEIAGRRLRTRIGVNTGMVLAGNLGSDFRFDYTLIGNTTNFASRLEGLNKYLQTNVLISEFTLSQIGDKFKVRGVGKFLVVGKTQPVRVYELLGPAENFRKQPSWLAAFDQALAHFLAREWDQAERLLREVVVLRGGADGPSTFLLGEISKLRGQLKPDVPWDGSVLLDSK